MRKGRQTPTTAFYLPYENSLGDEAVSLYNSTGFTALEWQSGLMNPILAINEDGLWTHTKFGLSVSRRNGKNEVVVIREMYGLVEKGEHILHTAHRTTTTHSAWERLYDRLQKADVEIVSIYRAYGKEHIELDNGGKIEFRTRTSKGGLGEGFDLLIIDEAQEYQDDQESALKYVVSSSGNPQTIFLGTPPTTTSSGTVFMKYREDVLAGKLRNSGWAEWSVEKKTDPQDREAWYQTNPSLGAEIPSALTERKIEDEVGNDDMDFNIQRLGLWIRFNLKSAISETEWDVLQEDTLPELHGPLYIGIKYGHDGENVAMSIACKTTGGEILTEGIDCRPVKAGTDWITAFLCATAASTGQVVVDGANGQQLLVDEMKDLRLKRPMLPTVKWIIAANANFERAIYGMTLCHMGQPALRQAATNCEKRAIGSNGGFGYRAIKDGVEIALLDSAVLAYAAAAEAPDKPKRQRISY